jgi:guanosine-3',5'-bis(diphosphate) 3'-pyrophosphohydrolase
VDFSYAVHTEVGHRTIGARVNGRLVPLESTLDNGDLVEVFTSKAPGAGPSRDWLGFVKSPRARNKIRAWFSKERRDEAIEQGKDAIARAMRKQNLPIQRILTGDSLVTLAHEMRYPDISSLYAAIGEGHVAAQNVVQKLVQALGGEEAATEEIDESVPPAHGRGRKRRTNADPGVVVKGVDDVWVKLARCCTPVPGDPIIGFVTRGSGVSVHRTTASTSSHCPASPSASSRSSGRPPSPRSSWSPSRSRPWTAPGSSRTSPASCPTSTSTSCPRPSRPPATAWPPPASPSRWATPSTWATS